MLADAIRSEAYRFSKNRVTALWSIAFFPVIALVLGIVGQMFIQSQMTKVTAEKGLPPEIAALASREALNLGDSLASLAGELANPMLILFVLIGAATIFAGDYRWESWRLTTARNSRLNLILGKVATAMGVTLTALALMLMLGMVGEVAKAMIFSRDLTFSLDAETAGQFGLLSLIAYVRVVQIALLALLAAVVTRSLIATLFVPIVVSVAQSIFSNLLPVLGWSIDDWWTHALFPGLSFDVLKAAIQEGPGDGVGLAIGGLVVWCVAPLIGAIAWFNRQDLSKE